MHEIGLVKSTIMHYISKMTLLEQLGRRVGELRRERKLSREQLARKAGLSPRFLADVEAGRGNIAISRLHDLCVAMDHPLAELMSSLPEAQHSGNGRRRRVVALVGLRGAGKTTIGRRVAARLRRKFVELDGLIEQAAGLALPNIFEVHGEDYYRRLEHEVLAKFLAQPAEAVLATGGGLVTHDDTYTLLRRNCVTFWLKAAPEDHWNRVLQQDPRPMAGDPNAMQQLQVLLNRRESLYALADHTIDTTNLGLPRSVNEVVALLKRS